MVDGRTGRVLVERVVGEVLGVAGLDRLPVSSSHESRYARARLDILGIFFITLLLLL